MRHRQTLGDEIVERSLVIEQPRRYIDVDRAAPIERLRPLHRFEEARGVADCGCEIAHADPPVAAGPKSIAKAAGKGASLQSDPEGLQQGACL
jgi:hypothetical protein